MYTTIIPVAVMAFSLKETVVQTFYMMYCFLYAVLLYNYIWEVCILHRLCLLFVVCGIIL